MPEQIPNYEPPREPKSTAFWFVVAGLALLVGSVGACSIGTNTPVVAARELAILVGQGSCVLSAILLFVALALSVSKTQK